RVIGEPCDQQLVDHGEVPGQQRPPTARWDARSGRARPRVDQVARAEQLREDPPRDLDLTYEHAAGDEQPRVRPSIAAGQVRAPRALLETLDLHERAKSRLRILALGELIAELRKQLAQRRGTDTAAELARGDGPRGPAHRAELCAQVSVLPAGLHR